MPPAKGRSRLEFPMKLASYKVRGRDSFGAVIGEGSGEGVVDLKTRLAPQFTSVLDLLRAGALDEARKAAAGAKADIALKDDCEAASIPRGQQHCTPYRN